mgnify:CR=1 FL=1
MNEIIKEIPGYEGLAVKAFSIITGETRLYPCIKKAAKDLTGKDWGFGYEIKKHGNKFNYREWRIEVMLNDVQGT